MGQRPNKQCRDEDDKRSEQFDAHRPKRTNISISNPVIEKDIEEREFQEMTYACFEMQDAAKRWQYLIGRADESKNHRDVHDQTRGKNGNYQPEISSSGNL